MTDQRKAVPLLVCSETIRNAILKGDRLAAGLAFGLGALAKCKGIAPESAQQSPVAPADERAAFDAWEKAAPVLTPFAAWQARARLAAAPADTLSIEQKLALKFPSERGPFDFSDAPTVSATDHPLTFVLGVLTEIAQSARQDKKGGFQAGGVRWGDIEIARRVVSAMLAAAPTPPTSAPADAWMTDDGRVCNAASRDGMHKVTQASYCIPLFKGAPPTSAADAELLEAHRQGYRLGLSQRTSIDVVDAERYRAWRKAAVEWNGKFMRTVQEALPPIRLRAGGETTEEQWDAAVDAAIAASKEST